MQCLQVHPIGYGPALPSPIKCFFMADVKVHRSVKRLFKLANYGCVHAIVPSFRRSVFFFFSWGIHLHTSSFCQVALFWDLMITKFHIWCRGKRLWWRGAECYGATTSDSKCWMPWEISLLKMVLHSTVLGPDVAWTAFVCSALCEHCSHWNTSYLI